MIKEINTVEEFNEIIKGDNILIDFNASWCGPCKMMEPHLEKLSEVHNEINVYSINVDNLQDIAIKLNISAIPTLIIFNNSNIIKRNTGYLSYQQLETFIK